MLTDADFETIKRRCLIDTFGVAGPEPSAKPLSESNSELTPDAARQELDNGAEAPAPAADAVEASDAAEPLAAPAEGEVA